MCHFAFSDKNIATAPQICTSFCSLVPSTTHVFRFSLVQYCKLMRMYQHSRLQPFSLSFMLRCYVAKELNNVDASRQFRSSRAYGKLESMFVRSIYFNPNYFFSVLLALLT